MESVGLLEPDEEEPALRTGSAGPGSGQGDRRGGSQEPPSLAESVWSGVSAAAESVRGLVGLSAGGEDGEGEETAGLLLSEEDGVGETVVEVEADGGRVGGELVSSVEGEEVERLHVFSLATGHLYERFLKVGGWMGGWVGGRGGDRYHRLKEGWLCLVDSVSGMRFRFFRDDQCSWR